MSLSESAQRDISKKDDADEKEKQDEINQSEQRLKDVTNHILPNSFFMEILFDRVVHVVRVEIEIAVVRSDIYSK
jgi:hypothetical protein